MVTIGKLNSFMYDNMEKLMYDFLQKREDSVILISFCRG